MASKETETELPGIEDSKLPGVICGKDERVKVVPNTSPPYSWICFVFVVTHGGMRNIASGFKIHLKDCNHTVVLTCGHILYTRGEMVSQVSLIFPGQEAVTVYTDSLYVPPEYIRSRNSDYDYGVILLPGTSDEGFGWSAILYDAELTDLIVNNCGYSDKPVGHLWITGGPITKYTDRGIYYMNDTTIGTSGSPVYTWDDGYWTVIGIHSGATELMCPNHGVRLIPEMIQRFYFRMKLMKAVTIRSQAYPEVYMRCDGEDVKKSPSGGGTVNCQYPPVEPDEWFYIYPVKMKPSLAPDGKYVVHLESASWNNVFIRMNGSGMSSSSPSGGGQVNCQYGAFSYERFYLRKEEGGTFSFQSFKFPHCFLRLAGADVTEHKEKGGGKVNCQYQNDPDQPAGSLQRFYVKKI